MLEGASDLLSIRNLAFTLHGKADDLDSKKINLAVTEMLDKNENVKT